MKKVKDIIIIVLILGLIILLFLYFSKLSQYSKIENSNENLVNAILGGTLIYNKSNQGGIIYNPGGYCEEGKISCPGISIRQSSDSYIELCLSKDERLLFSCNPEKICDYVDGGKVTCQ